MKTFKELLENKFSQQMVQDTLKAQKKYGFDAGKDNKTTYNNEVDAFKHTYMQWYLAFYFSDDIAKKLGDSHELDRSNNPSGESNMDLWNNQIGRKLAYEMSEKYGRDFSMYSKEDFFEIVSKKIVDKMKAGELITNPNDKRRYENMKYERLKEKDRIYSAEEYNAFSDKMKEIVMPNFLDYVIDNDWKVPHKSDLDKQVKSGELIYVDNYTRSDGTKVQGYYRHYPFYDK